MTQASKVAAFPVPPVVKQVEVPIPPARAFDLFTAGIARWWPVSTHCTSGEGGAVSCTVEPRVGGRVYELGKDGIERDWGRVLDWQPPHRFRFSWLIGETASHDQTVDVRFEAEGTGTRVTLTHDGWSKLPDLRAKYDGGWNGVLAAYVAAARA